MTRIKITNTTSTKAVVDHLYDSIFSHLMAGRSVLWLLSGGSGADICIDVSKRLAGVPTGNLYAVVSDERYGPVGHVNENTAQIISRGFVVGDMKLYRVLRGGSSASDTEGFASWIGSRRAEVDFSIALLGVGADAHTSGVKPYSIAVDSADSVVHFEGDDYSRITTTLDFLSDFDELVVQSFGESKHEALRKLVAGKGSVDSEPIRFIEGLDNYVFYSDL